MPSLKEHVSRSKERTGIGYKESNEWLNGDEVGSLNRLERCLKIKKYSKYVQSVWGERGLEEYRNHLGDDIKTFITSFSMMATRKIMRQIAQAPRKEEQMDLCSMPSIPDSWRLTGRGEI